jgi:hypothetical protein
MTTVPVSLIISFAPVLVSLSIVHSRVGFTWASNSGQATLPLGLPQQSLPLLLEGLLSQNVTLIELVPGITPAIINAATVATQDTYANAFR